jgi:hypothetical protein
MGETAMPRNLGEYLSMKENGTLPDFNKQTTDISARVDGIL